eukprot:6284501-Alexandrium_andersonii.AAC.1
MARPRSTWTTRAGGRRRGQGPGVVLQGLGRRGRGGQRRVEGLGVVLHRLGQRGRGGQGRAAL